MTSATGRLAQWVSGLTLESVPDAALDQARACLVDAVACAGAGAAMSKVRALGEAMRPLEGMGGPGRPWFLPYLSSATTEAFWNATLIHALDYDDSHKRSKTHPGAPVWAAAIAAARVSSPSMPDLFAGVVAGYEVTMRLGNAVGVEQHRRRGWHATSTCGTVGAAAAASRVMGLDAQQTASALGLGVTQAAGTWAFKADGALSKKIHPGHAARAGLTAAVSARAGVSGSAVALETCDGGFFPTFAGGVPGDDWQSVLAEVGAPFWLPEVALKPYPCCRTAHTAVDAALAMRDTGVSADRVRSVLVRTYGLAVEQCGFNDPVNATQAAFSTPYVVACALRDGWVGVEHFTEEAVADPELTRLQRLVQVAHDPRFDEVFPRNWPAELEVELTDGTTETARVDVALGDPNRPMSADQTQSKLRDSLSTWLDEDCANGLAHELMTMPFDGSLETLWTSLRRLNDGRSLSPNSRSEVAT